MDLGLVEHEGQLRASVRSELAAPVIQEELTALRTSRERDPDVRPLYRALGRCGLLAVNWPVEYGGRGRSLVEAAVVIEELVRAGVPDTLHVNTIQIVGLFLLMAGTPEQKATHLPRFARGERFASVLYTEPEAGSDLGALRTSAVRDGDGYRLDGVKVFSLRSDIADIALCAARTAEKKKASRYQGISLFLVDLHAEGIRRSTIPSIADEQFHRVELHDVRVGPGALVGREGEGWPLLSKALAVERTGLDYALKAERWFDTVVAGLGTCGDGAVLEQVGRYGAAVTAGRLLAWNVIERLDRGIVSDAAAALSKYHSSELAQQIAGWAPGVHGLGHGLPPASASLLESAYREAPGLTLSAGTSEMMLEIVSSSGLQEAPGTAEPDAVQQRLREAVRTRLAAAADSDTSARAALRDIGALTFEPRAGDGGLDLGLASGVVVCEEVGRAGLGDPYLSSALAIDALTAGGRRAALPPLLAGARTVSAAGFDTLPPGAGLIAEPAGDGWRLRGSVAIASAGSDCFLVPVALGAELALVLVPADRGALVRQDGLPDPLVAFDRLPFAATDVACRLGGGALPADPQGVLARTRIRQAAHLLGLAGGAHSAAVHHAEHRRQFGKPLSAFQSVAFRLAADLVRVEALRLLVRRAAWLADTARPYRRDAVEILALAAETATVVTRSALQVCGAGGLTIEASTARYYRRARVDALRMGLPAALWQEAAALRIHRSEAKPER